ncbi:hypothetical protein MMC24_002421 [Lignoscripta atroalba]|nr:hypothetical protein [Lignoscripta atroalba]
MFHDLPPIDLEHGHGCRNPAYGDRHGTECYVADPYMAKSFNAFGVEMPLHSWGNCRESALPRPLYMEQGRHFPSDTVAWRTACATSSPGFDESKVQKPWDMFNPWPLPFVVPGHVSPSDSGAGDRSTSEQDTCSAWSPEPSECRPENDDENARFDSRYEGRYSSEDGLHCHDYQQPRLTHSPGSSVASSFGSPRSDPGIALRDVQQYPDTYTEDNFERISHHRMGSEHPYYLGHPGTSNVPTKIGCLEQRLDRATPIVDRDGAVSTQLASSDQINTRNDTSHAGYESGSDYSPTGRTDRGHTRGSRNIPTDKLAKSPTHRSDNVNGGGTQKSRSNRITKSSPKRHCSTNVPAITTGRKNSLQTCPRCRLTLFTQSALNKHITTTHTRPFTCTFRIYGCTATFGSKNEWKRHVSSQHLRLGIWRCDQGACVPPSQHAKKVIEPAPEAGDKELIYNDFNRKDLFTQHLKRMHAPHNSCSKAEKDAFSMSIEPASKRCLNYIRQPPPYTVCGYCDAHGEAQEGVFQGSGAWEQRMEHVGRHLESGHGMTMEWKEDVDLRNWMVDEGLVEKIEGGAWRLVGLREEETKSKKSRRTMVSGNDG